MINFEWGSNAAPADMPQPAPDQHDYPIEFIGSWSRSWDGTAILMPLAQKQRATVFWEGLTKAERDALYGVYSLYATSFQTITLNDGRSFTGICVQNGFVESVWYDHRHDPYYDVVLVFEER
jgi:hypothetical protein